MAAAHVGDSATRSRTGASGTEHGRGSAAEELRVAWDGWSAAITAGYGEHPGSLHRKLHSDFLLRPRPVCQGVSEPPGKRQRASESQPGAPAQDAGVAPPGGAPEGSTPEASSTAGPADRTRRRRRSPRARWSSPSTSTCSGTSPVRRGSRFTRWSRCVDWSACCPSPCWTC